MERPASHLLLALEALVGAPLTGTTGLVRPADYRRCFLCAPFLPGSVCGGGKSRLAFVKLERRAHRGGNFNLLDLPNGWTAVGPLLRLSLFFLFGRRPMADTHRRTHHPGFNAGSQRDQCHARQRHRHPSGSTR